MELSGEEKRIRALFHEMRSEDGRVKPPFARTWNIAQARFDRPASSPALLKVVLNFPRLLAAALVIAFLIAAVVLWPQHPRPGRQSQGSLATQLPNDGGHAFEPPPKETSSVPRSYPEAKSGKRSSNVSRSRRLTSAGRAVAASTSRRVKESELSRWQSPTAKLLRSPGDELLRSVPALIQSAEEMRNFLSNLN